MSRKSAWYAPHYFLLAVIIVLIAVLIDISATSDSPAILTHTTAIPIGNLDITQPSQIQGQTMNSGSSYSPQNAAPLTPHQFSNFNL
ncbi:hypothetical protein KGQ71_03920 [Patescibacteria group bacterium]|nr:hypothetical protein [Patescibacteria group bacterium]